MEPAAAWAPCEFQPANWTVEEPAVSEVWTPAASLPVEYESIDIFPDIWSLQPCVPSSSSGGQHQQVVYNSYAAATQQGSPITEKAAPAAQESFDVDLDKMKMKIFNDNPIGVFEEATRRFAGDMDVVKMKIHRYPSSIQGIGEWCTIPRIVAIGPYHHGKRWLKQAENAKHVAAYNCIKKSGRSVEEMYHATVSAMVEIDAQRLYDKEVMEGIGDDEFLPMMFFDACFLVMYMLEKSNTTCEALLHNFLESNAHDIAHDIMLLENQIPWPVVDAIMKYISVPLAEFISNWKDGCLQDRIVGEVPTIGMDDSYKPPHLLGLLRFYIVGRRRRRSKDEVPGLEKMKSIAISVSAVELAEMGIKLAPNETAELADMHLTKEWIYFAKLSMVPLSLNDLRASLLVNMAAHELCTVPDFFDDKVEDEDSAVCSQLLLLCMLMNREDDVQHLRTSGILQGGAGLSNKQALDFFTSLQSLRIGRSYGCVMAQIESYRITRPLRIKVYAFLYNNWKAIVAVGSVIGVVASIIKAIKSLK